MAAEEGTGLNELQPVPGQAEMPELGIQEQRGIAQDLDSVVIKKQLLSIASKVCWDGTQPSASAVHDALHLKEENI